MVALAIAIVRTLTPEETLTAAFQPDRIDVPMAPSLGLVLDQVRKGTIFLSILFGIKIYDLLIFFPMFAGSL